MKYFRFLIISCWVSSSEVNSFLFAGEDALFSNFIPNRSMASFNCSIISIYILLSFLILIFIPKKVYHFPLVIDNFPKCFVNSWIIESTTAGSTWLILLSSIYQTIVHCLTLMILLATHRSYGFSSNPIHFKVVAYRLYHNITDPRQP